MMRTVAAATALALIGASATASAASQVYGGTIKGDEKATVKLEVQGHDERAVVTRFTVKRFPLTCESEMMARLARASLEGRAPVSDKGRFRLRASNEDQRLVVRGRLFGAHDARGKLNYSGLTEFADQTRDCHSGELRWVASR